MFNRENVEITGFSRGTSQDVQILASDGFVILPHGDQDQREFWHKTSESTKNMCARSGALPEELCRNFIQFVKIIGDKVLFCGTNAAFQTCYVGDFDTENERLQPETPLRHFSANHLVGPEPKNKGWVQLFKNYNIHVLLLCFKMVHDLLFFFCVLNLLLLLKWNRLLCLAYMCL